MFILSHTPSLFNLGRPVGQSIYQRPYYNCCYAIDKLFGLTVNHLRTSTAGL